MSQIELLRAKMLELGDKVQILYNENDKDTNIMSPYKRRMHKKLIKENKEKIHNLSSDIEKIKKQITLLKTPTSVPVSSVPVNKKPVRIDYSPWTRRPRMGLYIA
jgi:hypothetical protein